MECFIFKGLPRYPLMSQAWYSWKDPQRSPAPDPEGCYSKERTWLNFRAQLQPGGPPAILPAHPAQPTQAQISEDP